VQVHVRDRHSNSQYAVPGSADPLGGWTVAVPLFEGFNDIQAEYGDPSLGGDVSAPVRTRTVLYLPGTTPSFGFTCTVSPRTVTVPTLRSIDLTVSVTGTSQTGVSWSVDGGAANGTVTQSGTYTAPCAAPPGPATVRASSAVDPSKSCTAQITILAGIAVTAIAATGTPADPAVPSANVGQIVTIDIPAAVYGLTGTGFPAGQAVVFATVERSPAGTCTTSAVPVQGNVATGLTSLTVAVPSCADADQTIQVPGNGCARLQIVPTITSLDITSVVVMLINGTGFVCGATDVYVGTTKVLDAQVLAVYCTVIVVDTENLPILSQPVTVQTNGGVSNPVSGAGAAFTALLGSTPSCDFALEASWPLDAPVATVNCAWYFDGTPPAPNGTFAFATQAPGTGPNAGTIVGNVARFTAGPLYPSSTTYPWYVLVQFYDGAGAQLASIYSNVDTTACANQPGM